MVVRVDAVMAAPTSLAPSTAASSGPRPSSRKRKMFSKTTMALSTSIPTPKARPPKDIKFKLSLLKYIKTKVATIEIGIAAAITRVGRRLLRKK